MKEDIMVGVVIFSTVTISFISKEILVLDKIGFSSMIIKQVFKLFKKK